MTSNVKTVFFKTLMKKYFRDRQEDTEWVDDYLNNHYHYINGSYYDDVYIKTINQSVTGYNISGTNITIDFDVNLHTNQKIYGMNINVNGTSRTNNSLTVNYEKTNSNNYTEIIVYPVAVAYEDKTICNGKGYAYYTGFHLQLANQYIYLTDDTDGMCNIKCDNLIEGQTFIIKLTNNQNITGTITSEMVSNNNISRIKKDNIQSVELSTVKHNNNLYIGSLFNIT